ncbi:MAG: hypothetical protein JKY56_11255 [Kofleriaceae bacterium]|nr:hypothetical protein [Kofleriaceae bacterium]
MKPIKRDTQSSLIHLAVMMALSLGSGLGCSTKLTSFVCQQNEDCVANERAGRCEDTMFCSFSDTSCPSNFRYGSASGAMSDMCTGEALIGDAASPDIVDGGRANALDAGAHDNQGRPSIAMALGRSHTCVLLEEHLTAPSDRKSVSTCWGDNTVGQLGTNVSTGSDGSPQSSFFNGGSGIATGITAGHHTTCRYNELVFECFGDDGNARLGPGTSYDYNVDTIDIGPGDESAVCIDGTRNSGMIPNAAPIYCWGSNTFGQIQPAMGSTTTLNQAPFQSFLTDETVVIDELGVGKEHVCVLTSQPGLSSEITCWGNSEKFQVGKRRQGPVKIGDPSAHIFGPTLIDELMNPVRLAVGYNHSCAIDRDGTVFCWGGNGAKQTAPNTAEPAIEHATRITGLNKRATALSLGKDHSCAIANDTQVYCWGSNALGQLGQGDNTATIGDPVVGMEGTRLMGVDRIESGQDHTCAHVPAKGVYCWGLNDEHQIDTTSTTRYFSAVLSYAESE